MGHKSSNGGLDKKKDSRAVEFANWGMPDVAFVKRMSPLDGDGWSIHTADGTQVGMAPSRDLAFAAILQHELEPYSVH